MGIRETFSNNLKTLRTSRGLTQEALSALIGVDHKTIYHYEKKARNPSPEVLDALADALKVSPALLLTDGAIRVDDFKYVVTPEEALEVLSSFVAEKMAQKSPIPAHYIKRLEQIDPALLDKLFEDAVPAYEADDALRHSSEDPEKDL